MIHTPATHDRLYQALATAAPHLRPIIEAVRDHGVGMMFAPQGSGAFRLPRKQASITILGDDFSEALGPDAFHMPSVRRAIRSAGCFAVVSSAPQQSAYTAMAVAAVISGRNTLIVETRPEQEIQWVHLIQKLAPRRFIWLATVKAGRA